MPLTPALFVGYRDHAWTIPSSCSHLYIGTSDVPPSWNADAISIVIEHSKPFHFSLENGFSQWTLRTWDLMKPAALANETAKSRQYVFADNERERGIRYNSATLERGAYTLHFLENTERIFFFVPAADEILEVGGRALVASKKEPGENLASDLAVPIHVGGLIEGFDDFLKFVREAADPGNPRQVDEHNDAVLRKYYRNAFEKERYGLRTVVWPNSQIEDPRVEVDFLFHPSTGKIGAFKNQSFAERARYLSQGRMTVSGEHPYVARVDFDPRPLPEESRRAIERLPVLISRLQASPRNLKP